MGQEYGAAQPLVDTLKKLEKKYNPAEWVKSAPQKQDTSWHDEMVRKATESFTKPSQVKASTSQKTVVKKKKAPTKKPATKRVAGK